MPRLTADYYRTATDDNVKWLIDVTEIVLGTEAWGERFGRTPQQARESEAHHNTRDLSEWGSLIHENQSAAQRITKARLDSFRDVISARHRETVEHKRQTGRTQDQVASDTRHEYFTSVLREVLGNLVWVEERCHPSAASFNPFAPVNFSAAAASEQNSGEAVSTSTRSSTEPAIDHSSDDCSIPIPLTSRLSPAAEEDSERRLAEAEAVRVEQQQKKPLSETEKQQSIFLAFLDNVTTDLDLLCDTVRHCARSELALVTMAFLINTGIGKLEAKVNAFVLQEFDGNDTHFVDELYKHWAEGVNAVSKHANGSANKKKVMKYELAKRHFLPATEKIRDLGRNRLDFLVASGQSGLINYGSPIPVGKTLNGDQIKLKSAKPVDQRWYLLNWENDTLMFLLREWQRISTGDTAGTDRSYHSADRLTQYMADSFTSQKIHGWYPMVLQLLVFIVHQCAGATKSPGKALLYLAENLLESLQDLFPNGDLPNINIYGEMESLIKNILQDPVQSRLVGRTIARTSEYPPAYPDINPLLSCNQHLGLLYLSRVAAKSAEAVEPYLHYTLHIYNMMRTMGGLTTYWDDAEFIMQYHGYQAIFGQGSRPSTWEEIQQCIRRIPSLSQNHNFVAPSRLLRLAYADSREQSAESAEKLRQYILDSMQTEKDPTLSEQLEMLQKIAAREQFDWHFGYFNFRLDVCAPLTELTANTLFLHLADGKSWTGHGFQYTLETLVDRLAVRGLGSYNTLKHLRRELERRIELGPDNTVQQMECDADLRYPRS